MLMRAGQNGPVERRHAVGPPSAAAIADRWRAGQGRAVLNQMSDERRIFLQRWTRQNQLLIRRYGCKLADVRWSSRTTLGARLLPKALRNGAFKFTVEIDSGTMLAVDDVVGCVFSSAGFLSRYERKRSMRPEPIVFTDDRIGRFIRYPALRRCFSDVASVVTAIPSNPTRLRSASLFSALALDWVHLHEQSHFILGHADLLLRGTSAVTLQAFDELGQDTVLRAVARDQIRRRALEFQADGQALELLFLEHLSQDAKSASDLLDENSRSNVAGRASLWSKRGLSEYRRAARILIVAACVVALLFERGREMHDVGGHHPLPSARLLHLFMVGTSLAEEFLGHFLRMSGRPPLSEDRIREMLTLLLVECQADLAIAAMVMSIADPDLIYDETSKDPLRTPFFEDTFRIFGTGDTFDGSIAALRTAGAREFAEVHKINDEVFAQLASIHRGGTLLASRLGDRVDAGILP